jgi:hypothetical protein
MFSLPSHSDADPGKRLASYVIIFQALSPEVKLMTNLGLKSRNLDDPLACFHNFALTSITFMPRDIYG